MNTHFTARKKYVRYGGYRWRLVSDRGRWLYIERGTIHRFSCWIPAECAK